MRSHPLLLGFFFLLFIVTSSLPAQAKVREMSVTKAEGPVDIEADELTYERETQTYEAHGQVEVSRGSLSLKADHARLNMATKEMVAWGSVLLREGEDVIECQRLEVNLDTRLGRIHQAKLFLKDQNFRITGQEVEKLGENHYRIREGSLTTCDAERPPWKFTVKELEVREMALGGWGTAKGPIFYFEGIPVLYFPWGAFPVRQERQSGFLVPHGGYSSKDGPHGGTGFYWAFAKNMDASFYLDWVGSRGFKEGLEYRYALTRETEGKAIFYFISDKTVPNDADLPVINGQTIHHNRYAYFIEHQQTLPGGFYLKGDINRVSDHMYLQDFDRDIPERASIDSWSARQLRSVVFGGKNWDGVSFLAQTAVYDDLTQASNDATIQKLPQISLYAHPQSFFGIPLFFDLTSSYSNFWREESIEAQRRRESIPGQPRGVSVPAQRWDLFPRITFPIRLFDVLKFESDIGGRETFYKIDNDPTGTFSGRESRETFVAGMGMSTEFYRVYDGESLPKISNLFNISKWMHTVEPAVRYQYSPRVDQDEIPVFDEVDRIPYTNQITYGVTQRLIGKPEKERVSSGPYEYGKLIISQSYSLGDPITINSTGNGEHFSNIQGELWWNFNPYLSVHSDAELNPNRWSFDLFNALVQAKDRRDDVVQVQYRSTRGTDRQINVNGRIKTINPLYLYGGFYYNLRERTRVQTIYGAEYQSQCWSVGFFVTDKNRSPDRTQRREWKFSFYFTLLNIGSGGSRPYFMQL
jgi:LPS-assembly protein